MTTPPTREARALPDGWGRAGVELGGTSGYRVGRGRGCRLGVVERHTVEPVFPRRGPLDGTAARFVPRPVGFPRRRHRWVPPCLGVAGCWRPAGSEFDFGWVTGTVDLIGCPLLDGESGAPVGVGLVPGGGVAGFVSSGMRWVRTVDGLWT